MNLQSHIRKGVALLSFAWIVAASYAANYCYYKTGTPDMCNDSINGCKPGSPWTSCTWTDMLNFSSWFLSSTSTATGYGTWDRVCLNYWVCYIPPDPNAYLTWCTIPSPTNPGRWLKDFTCVP